MFLLAQVSLAFFLLTIATQNVCAAPQVLRESLDCPIANPFAPKPAAQHGSNQHSRIYSMQGYKINRIQISSDHPNHLEIIWTPVEAMWGQKTAEVSIDSKNPQCFLIDSSFPVHTPAKQIEILSNAPMEKLIVSFSDVPWDHEGPCPAKKLCPIFMQDINTCKASLSEKSCMGFMDNLHQLTAREQCRRTFDTGAVPAIWLCDDINKQKNTTELTMHLLKSLKFKKAEDYYKSSEFISILDGALSEEYNGLLDDLDNN